MMNIKKCTFQDLLQHAQNGIYFHLSTDVDKDGVFIPTIPPKRASGEDDTIERVCVSTTIEGCLASSSQNSISWEAFMYETMGYIKVFVIIPDELGIDAENVVTAKELKEKELVPDADITSECWILESFEVPAERQFIVSIVNIEEEENGLPSLTFCESVLTEDKTIQFGCVDAELMTQKIKETLKDAYNFSYSGHFIMGMSATFPKGTDLSEIFHFHRKEGQPPIHLIDDHKWR